MLRQRCSRVAGSFVCDVAISDWYELIVTSMPSRFLTILTGRNLPRTSRSVVEQTGILKPEPPAEDGRKEAAD